MKVYTSGMVAAALAALGACASAPETALPAAVQTAPDAYAGKSVLDAAIAAAGGEAALRQVKELDWSGSALVTADGKTTEIEVQTVVRPFKFARSTTWPKADGAKAAKTIQAELGQAWLVSRVVWNPMSDAQAAHENQQFALYGVMMLAPLKDAGAKVQETAPGKDGTRNLHVEYLNAPPIDLRFDASAKLIRAAYSVRDPSGGLAPLAQVAEFSGEVTSNGVKWPKRIAIRQNDAPYFDLQIATFEARATPSTAPIEHTLGEGAPPPPGVGGRPG